MPTPVETNSAGGAAAACQRRVERGRDVVEFLRSYPGKQVSRRSVLKAAAAGAGVVGVSPLLRAAQYPVGVGRGTDAYTVTNRAIDACGEWGALPFNGKVVVIKPNLVGKALPSTGITTDSQVVRAIVDRALAGGAILVVIVESGANGSNFAECGYSFFDTYDPLGRVRLLDLGAVPTSPIALNGWIYKQIYSKPLALNRAFVHINVAKLKTHAEVLATLAIKNNFGLPAIDRYLSFPPGGRFGMHDRGVQQAVVDNYLLRVPDFHVVDGIVAMEGEGPWAGAKVAFNTVLAGRNGLAVDRLCLFAMGLPQTSVRYLNYVSALGLGPAGLSGVDALGDTLTPRSFVRPARLPVDLEPTRVVNPVFTPGSGQSASIQARFNEACDRTITIQRLSDVPNTIEVVRTLVARARRDAGVDLISWDGRDDNGSVVAAGRYAVHSKAERPDGLTRASDATSWVTVQ